MDDDTDEIGDDIRETLRDMPKLTHRPHLTDAMTVLGLNQTDMADFLGISARTLQRWNGTLRYATEARLQALAHAVHPKDPGLAAEIALLAGTTPEAFGLVTPKAPDAVIPARAAPSIPVLVDSVVCAAAEAASVLPAAIRPALHAAFLRCREAGLSLDEVEETLRPRSPTPRPRGA